MSRFYSKDGGWAGLQNPLEQAGRLSGRRFTVTDAQGVVGGDSQLGIPQPSQSKNRGANFVPIQIDGRRAGALLVANPGNVDMIRDPAVSRLANAVNARLLGTGLIAAIAGIFLIALMSQRILAPVHSLTSAASYLGRGNLAQRVGDSAPGEIGQLARTFNAMASNLEQRRSSGADWSLMSPTS